MADPLSIAASIMGITAAGVQASVKLYALAEKVATADQRVASIADDVSSTCAILNQVRELIIPQPDAQGILRSVFNSAALLDISHGLQRCRSAFMKIEAVLHRAFDQVGKHPALQSKIKLSRFQRAKWPFLQSQFEDLRNDLRDAKSNLVLMIAVASLALAQRDGRQRPIHESERLELGSTIVQLQRARTSKPLAHDTREDSPNQEPGLRSLSGKRDEVDFRRNLSSMGNHCMVDEEMSTSRSLDLKKLARAIPMVQVWPMSRTKEVRERNWRKIFTSSMHTPKACLRERGVLNMTFTEESIRCEQDLAITTALGYFERQGPSAAQTLSIYGLTSSPNIVMSMPPVVAYSVTEVSRSICLLPNSAKPEMLPEHYYGWNTDCILGLKIKYGQSLQMVWVKLPEQMLKALVKAYTDEGNDPYAVIIELTKQQRQIITDCCPTQWQAKVEYVRSQRGISVSSVFGTLSIETLEWIVTSKIAWPPDTTDKNAPIPTQRQYDRWGAIGPPPARTYGPPARLEPPGPMRSFPVALRRRFPSRVATGPEKHSSEAEKNSDNQLQQAYMTTSVAGSLPDYTIFPETGSPRRDVTHESSAEGTGFTDQPSNLDAEKEEEEEAIVNELLARWTVS